MEEKGRYIGEKKPYVRILVKILRKEEEFHGVQVFGLEGGGSNFREMGGLEVWRFVDVI